MNTRLKFASEMPGSRPQTSGWAISVQSHCDNDRPTSSGRSQAIFTTWIATSGGNDRLAAASGTIVPPVEPTLQEPLDPLAHVLFGQVHPPGDLDQRQSVGDPQDRATAPSQAQRGGGAARRCSS